jgi:AcrR family transcriptional regulator
MLSHEAIASGTLVLDQHGELNGIITNVLCESFGGCLPGGLAPVTLSTVLVAAPLRLLSILVRRGRRVDEQLAAGLHQWIAVIGDALSPDNLSELETLGAGLCLRADPAPGLMPCRRTPRRRRAASASSDEFQRQLIVQTTAELIGRHGYGNVTVADITDATRISRESFYARFSDRRAVAEEAISVVFRSLIGQLSGAFFGAHGRPQRMWSAATRFAEMLMASPAVARFAFLTSHGIDVAAARQVDGLLMAFTIFLRWGAPRDGQGRGNVTIAEATATMGHEVIGSCLARMEPDRLMAVLPFAFYLVLAPYVGPDEAMSMTRRLLEDAVAD